MTVRELLNLLMNVQDPDNTEILAASFDNEEAYDFQALDSMLTKEDGAKALVIVLEPTGDEPVGTHNPYEVDEE